MLSVIVEMRDVRKDYPLGKTVVHALRKVDLELEAGEFTALAKGSGTHPASL